MGRTTFAPWSDKYLTDEARQQAVEAIRAELVRNELPLEVRLTSLSRGIAVASTRPGKDGAAKKARAADRDRLGWIMDDDGRHAWSMTNAYGVDTMRARWGLEASRELGFSLEHQSLRTLQSWPDEDVDPRTFPIDGIPERVVAIATVGHVDALLHAMFWAHGIQRTEALVYDGAISSRRPLVVPEVLRAWGGWVVAGRPRFGLCKHEHREHRQVRTSPALPITRAP